MIQRMLLTVALLMLIGNQTVFAQANPEETHGKIKDAISAESKAQKKADDWDPEKMDILYEIRDLKTRVTWLEYQKEKHRIYIGRVKENIANLEYMKLEARKVREQLDPYLEEVLNRLEEFVNQDVPFYPDERAVRLERLRDALNNYQIPLSEKLRRVFQDLQVETIYGKMLASDDTTLALSEGDTQVTQLVLGRVAMFYLSLDEALIGRWNHDTRQWEPIPESFIRPLRRLMDMAERKRSAELIQIPLGAL